MKNDRQKKIIELVENRCIETQEQLLDQLRQCGFHSTQATVSRDIKELHYYRDKNSNEIDLIMESDGQLHPIEIKKSINPPTQITGAFKLLDKASVPRGTGAIICLREALSAIDSSTYIVPVWMI